MSSVWFFIVWLLFVYSHAAVERICDPDNEDGVCEEIVIHSDEETLGQKLLQKQSEFYHLNKLSYSDDNAAQSIKIHNPNHETYDYYWFDPNRNKGNLIEKYI